MTRPTRAGLVGLATAMAFAAAVVCWRLDVLPIEIWDEARLANNAWEMSRSGLSLVTTYGGVPDHWNTKPPLVIWLMSLAIRAFGANEWAIRLPSALAAVGTAGFVFAFCAFHLKRPLAGFVALVLLFNPGTYVKGLVRCLGNDYVQFHAARSGDYDALLTLCTTGYLIAAYLYLNAPAARKSMWLALAAAGIAFAFLTKTIQGLIFLPAVVAYAAWQRKLIPMLRARAVHVSGAMLVLLCVAYYFVREQLDPGYFAAAMYNDLLGRYAIAANAGGPFYYVSFFPLLALAIAIGQWAWGRGEVRQASMYLGLAALFYIVVISSSVNKQVWYVVPALPLVAIIVALGLDDLVERVNAGRAATGVLIAACVFAGAATVRQSASQVSARLQWKLGDPRNQLDNFLRGPILRASAPKRFVVFQESFVPGGVPGDAFYVGPTRFYVNVLRAAGYSIDIRPAGGDVPFDAGSAVLCGPAMRDAVGLRFTLEPVRADGGCGIYRMAAK